MTTPMVVSEIATTTGRYHLQLSVGYLPKEPHKNQQNPQIDFGLVFFPVALCSE